MTEILIVLSIFSFLILLTTIYLRTQIFKGNDARRKTDLARIKIAVEEYEKDHDCYPLPSLLVCSPAGSGLRPYLDKIPCDPVSGESYFYEPENLTCPSWYRIYAKLENEKDSDYLAGIGPDSAYSYYVSSPNAPSLGGEPPSGFYGCFSGVCQPISWDPARPGPECDPNYGSLATCNEVCGVTVFTCTPW